MATLAQVEANIENAKHSTGPRTQEGKAVSSQNALKHGLTAQTVLLPGEDEAAYRKLCTETFGYWKPANAQEDALVQYLCDTQWRLNRCSRLEAAALSADVPDFKALDCISKHEARLKKNHSATFKEVRDLINTRLDRQQDEMEDAKTIRSADQLENRESDLQAIGFALSVEDVDTAMARDLVLEEAERILSKHAFQRL